MPINMSHCRHTNTLTALREVMEDLDRTSDLSTAEAQARDNLLVLCRIISESYEAEIDEIVTQRKRERAQAKKLQASK